MLLEADRPRAAEVCNSGAELRSGARHDPLMAALEQGAPVDLVFQSIAGTEAANRSFGVNLALLDEACAAARELTARGGLRASPQWRQGHCWAIM